MSTDKTLADVKPGGRVRLGDAPWPEIDAILADAYSAGAEGLPFEGIARRAAVRAAVAALSAQPSPGGQGDALAALPLYRLADDANGNRGLHRDDTGSWVKLQDVERALAARQPVGEPVRVSGDMVDGELSVASAIDQVVELFPSADRAALRTLAACFTHHSIYRYADPPAQCAGEPVAWMDPDGSRVLTAKAKANASGAYKSATSGYTVPLYPTAQAVDLGAVPDGWRLSKKATCYQLSHGNDIIGNLVGPDAEENAAIIARVLDSQAVGR